MNKFRRFSPENFLRQKTTQFAFAIMGSFVFSISPLRAQLPDDPQFQQAANLFFRDRFDQAIAAMNNLLASPSLDRRSQILAYQFLAFSYYTLEDGKANTLIRKVLEQDLHAEADPVIFKSDYIKFFRYQKAQNLGRVQIDSRPSGARVLINNKSAGVTPIDTLLLSGQYDFRLEREGFRPKQEVYLIQGGQETISRTIALERNPKFKNLRWYAAGGALLAGGTIYFLTKKDEVLADLPGPPGTPSKP